MVGLNQLPKLKTKAKKRIGRGYGSGKGGHTVGRGAKGAKARGKIALTFTGAKVKKSFVKRLPLFRGKGKLKLSRSQPMVVNVEYLNFLPKGTVVDLRSLVDLKIIDGRSALKNGVKILGDGDLNVALKVALPCSKGAVKKIEKAGGEVIAPVAGGLAKKSKTKKSPLKLSPASKVALKKAKPKKKQK